MADPKKRKNDGGQRIIDGLNEAIDWANGHGTAHVSMPGQPGREMTRQQYEMERILREQDENAPRLIPRRRGDG